MSSKKICAHCNKPITDTAVMALGKCWHKDHFLCAHCKQPLKDAKYIQENNQAYCEADWKELFQLKNLPICAECNVPIRGVALSAMGKNWHKDHFTCHKCKQPFNSSKFFEDNGLPYCEADYKALHSKAKSEGRKSEGAYARRSQEEDDDDDDDEEEKEICAWCNKPILDTVLTAMGKKWHKDHFVCNHCKQPIREAAFSTHEGKPYCEKDYTALFRKKCSGCGEVITDTVLNAMDKPWHKKCFKCTKCGKVIEATSGFTERNGKALCLGCK